MKKNRQEKQVAVYQKGKVPREVLTLKKDATFEKVASNDVAITRMTLGSQGIDGLHTSKGSIQEYANSELRWPESICTYKRMSLDPTVAAVNNFYNMMIGRAQFKFIPPDYNDDTPFDPDGKDYTEEDVKAAALFLNYCMSNMEGQTWKQFISGIGTYRLYGFSIAEKVWTTVTVGKYKGRKKWKTLAPRSQETVESWVWDKKDPDRLTGVVQKPRALDVERYGVQSAMAVSSKEQRTIDRSKIILFRFDPVKNNPQGTSPLDGCWEAWKYLQLVREYQAIGVAKDMG